MAKKMRKKAGAVAERKPKYDFSKEEDLYRFMRGYVGKPGFSKFKRVRKLKRKEME
jgi:hypothetical protein